MPWPHKVIAAFRFGGVVVAPPGTWTPPTQEVAAKLVASGCLKASRPPRNAGELLAKLDQHAPEPLDALPASDGPPADVPAVATPAAPSPVPIGDDVKTPEPGSKKGRNKR